MTSQEFDSMWKAMHGPTVDSSRFLCTCGATPKIEIDDGPGHYHCQNCNSDWKDAKWYAHEEAVAA
jgi:hypothetical protein